MAKKNKGEFDAQLPVLINDNVTQDITPARHRSVEQDMSDSVLWLEDSATLEGVITFGNSVKISIYNGGANTLPDGYYLYLLDSESGTTKTLPTFVENQVIEIWNEADVTMTLSGGFRFMGNNINTITMRSYTRRKFIGIDGKWVPD